MFNQDDFMHVFGQARVRLRPAAHLCDDDVMAPSCGENAQERSQQEESAHEPETKSLELFVSKSKQKNYHSC